jgi:integrase
MPAFIAKLRESKDSLSAVVLELIALTACRSNEVRGMRFDEIDWREGLWTVLPERMKRSRNSRCRCLGRRWALLKTLDETKAPRAQLVFLGPQPGKSIANQGLWAQVGRVTGKAATTHGLRSSFRSWAADHAVPRAVAEYCLAHAKGDAVEAAYSRAEMISLRRPVMQKWADFICGDDVAASGKVVAIDSGQRKRR